MKILDAHAHLGKDVVFDCELTETDLLDTCARYGVSQMLVQPFLPRPYIEEIRQIHDRIYDLTTTYPGRFFGMASICPHLRDEEVEAEATRCKSKLGFRGIKIATTAQGVNPAGRSGMHIFETAAALNLPVMVHTGGGNFGDPLLLEKAAAAFPQLPIIIAHGGNADVGIEAAIHVAQSHANVFVEPSWVNLLGVAKMGRILGAGKLMFSSDMPENTPAELALFRAVFTDPQDLALVMGDTARGVFCIPV